MKTSDLTGPALDWAVAKCLPDDDFLFNPDPYLPDENGQPNYFTPSSDWTQGGPIIEREEIAIGKGHEQWAAFANSDVEDGTQGPTPLVAAMRCFVASRLGDEVDVPEELI